MANKLISVVEDTVSFNKYDKPLFFQCEHTDRIRTSFYNYTYENTRCGRDSDYIVTLEGELTGNIFTKRLCKYHANPYLMTKLSENKD